MSLPSQQCLTTQILQEPRQSSPSMRFASPREPFKTCTNAPCLVTLPCSCLRSTSRCRNSWRVFRAKLKLQGPQQNTYIRQFLSRSLGISRQPLFSHFPSPKYGLCTYSSRHHVEVPREPQLQAFKAPDFECADVCRPSRHQCLHVWLRDIGHCHGASHGS